MKVWTLSFFNDGLDAFEIGVYSSRDLAIEAMNLYSQINGYHNLDDIDMAPWGATCWCDEGRYEILCHELDSMPEE